VATKRSIGFSTVGVDHSYDVFEVSKIDKFGEAGNEFDNPPNTITRPSEAKELM
jgi:hypothetical protein